MVAVKTPTVSARRDAEYFLDRAIRQCVVCDARTFGRTICPTCARRFGQPPEPASGRDREDGA